MAKSKHHREKRDVKRPPHVPHVPHVSVTIDGRVYHIPVSPPQISVQALIDLAFGLQPMPGEGAGRHALTVLVDTGGSEPTFADVKGTTIQGPYLITIRGGEAYASGAGAN
jgi:hypothetical protein